MRNHNVIITVLTFIISVRKIEAGEIMEILKKEIVYSTGETKITSYQYMFVNTFINFHLNDK